MKFRKQNKAKTEKQNEKKNWRATCVFGGKKLPRSINSHHTYVITRTRHEINPTDSDTHMYFPLDAFTVTHIVCLGKYLNFGKQVNKTQWTDYESLY